MNQGRSIFSQLTGHLPHKQFTRCVQRYEGERYVKSFFGTSENAVKTQIWPETAWQELENYLAVRKACPREEENPYLAFERKNTECFHFNGIGQLAT
jgi:hypothetical protein